ncbi:unnamed protein product, partial [Ilex paraguariensis]
MSHTKLRNFGLAVGLNSFMANTKAEKNMWLLWNDNLEVKSMLHFEQAMTVSVSYQGADPVLVTVVYGCCDLLVKEALVGTLIGYFYILCYALV